MQALKRIPKPKSIAEAIDLDNSLEYIPVSKDLHKEILEDNEKEQLSSYRWNGEWVPTDIVNQLARYSERPEGSPSIIMYEGTPVRAVSALFQRIPLENIWEAATKQLGEPVLEKPTTQAIVAQFNQVKTHYKRSGEMTSEDYELRPTIAFSYNFAERSFMLGFTVEVFFCTNQMFVFEKGAAVKVIHNIYHMKDFNLEDSIKTLLSDNLQTIEQKIDTAQNTPIPAHGALPFYWKASQGKLGYLKDMFAQHEKEGTENLWQAVNHVTFVTSHQTKNYSSAVDMSARAGSILIKTGKLYPDDHVRALGFYMQKQRERSRVAEWGGDDWLERADLKPLKAYVQSLCEPIPEIIAEAEISEEE